MPYIKRNIEKIFKEMEKTFPVVMVTGPRQVGKTTMLKELTENEKINYVTLDNLDARALAKEDPELFLRTYETPLIIDEFQYAPNILSYIKIIVDEKRQERVKDSSVKVNGLFYLTGSQAFEIMEETSESLAGRVGILDLYTLSNREMNGLDGEIFLSDLKLLKKRKKTEMLTTSNLFEKILNGGYPEIFIDKDMDRAKFFDSYIRTYIERDIRKLINVQDEIKFYKFIGNVAARTAQELNITDICKDIGITNTTGEKWLSILVNTGVVFLLGPYSNNTVARVVKRPKIYMTDTGLSCYLAGYLDSLTLKKSAYNGAIFETYVVTEILKSFANNGEDARKHLYYYRDNNGKVIDLLIIYDNVIYPIEIKKSASPKTDAIKNFDVVKKFGMQVGNGGVICMKQDIFPIDKDNNYIPIEYL